MRLNNLAATFKQRFLPHLIARSVKFLMRITLFTCKIEVEGLHHFIEAAKSSSCIIALWHNQLAILSEVILKNAPQFTYTAFISKSRDGDHLEKLINSYSMGKVIRVPHNARHQALSQMINRLKNSSEVIIITPDGPRGPLHVVKPGIIMAVEKTGAKIVPFSWHSDRMWRLNTWDKMFIPKPFTKIKVIFGRAI